MNDRDDKAKAKGTGIGTATGAAAGGVAGGATAGALAGGVTGPVGAAVGAAVGAGIGAVSGHEAADSDSGRDRSPAGAGSRHTVIGAFDETAGAQRAVDRLVQGGFTRDDVHVEHRQGSGPAVQRPEDTQRDTEHQGGGFFSWLFGSDDEGGDRQRQPAPHAGHAYAYDEALRRGSAIVIVDVDDEREADKACSLLEAAGAVDVDERAKQWRSEGWNPPGLAASHAPQGAVGASQASAGTRDDPVLDVVEEQLHVGKRSVEKGGVRVIQRVSSKPVRELIRLREERAVVDRRPVDRPATGQDLSNFREGTLEVHETVEEPVVAKTTRVVEEVRVGKEVREREETIEDTVRRKDVEVERLAGEAGRTPERERAVASDRSPAGLRKGSDKDKPTL